jgi:hypothetical protein
VTFEGGTEAIPVGGKVPAAHEGAARPQVDLEQRAMAAHHAPRRPKTRVDRQLCHMLDEQLVFEHTCLRRFALAGLALGMPATWLGHADDAVAREHSVHLAQQLPGIGQMVEGVEEDDGVHRSIADRKMPSIVRQELRIECPVRQPVSLERTAAKVEARRRDVYGDSPAPELVEHQ